MDSPGKLLFNAFYGQNVSEFRKLLTNSVYGKSTAIFASWDAEKKRLAWELIAEIAL